MIPARQSQLRGPAFPGPFHLEQTMNLTPPVVWTAVTNKLTSDGYWNSVALSNVAGTGQRFFRLIAR